MDGSTLRDSEAVLLAYVQLIDAGQFSEERLEGTTKSQDIYNKLKNYLELKNISMKYITSCAVDGAPNMMAKKNGCLKLIKDINPEIVIVHCVNHKKHLVAKNISPVLNKPVPNLSVFLGCFVKSKMKAMLDFYFILNEFLNDKPEMKILLTIDGKAFVGYLTDIFEKLNILNKQLQGPNKTLVDAKAKIFGFITNIELYIKQVGNRNFEQFHWLQKCKATSNALLVMTNHLDKVSVDMKERFSDLKQIDFPAWMLQPVIVDLTDISDMQYQEELAEFQNNESANTLFNRKGAMVWLCQEIEAKYPKITKCARKLFLPFPTSYLVECGFSAVNDLLIKKRNRLDITERGDLRLKLS
ncbi:protein ZBED8-like [Ctenocephalides felis]|uniref:protein ZBED8-like n=1 Tax=Ctenocephalides felis TaxID=7515 RepID=UPI000E6E4AC1|nr:protein ZBED8-like [Ctenocephalides felis]